MDNNFDEKSALQLIEGMLKKTQEEVKDNSFFFLFWGYLVLIAATANYYLLVYTSFEFHAIPWVILMPLGGILTAIIGAKQKKQKKVETFVSENLRYVIHAFSISLFVVCFCMSAANLWQAFYPTIMIIYGIWLYVSGGMLKFKPLMYGGLLNFLVAGITYFLKQHELHLILFSIAVTGGYIIPGHMLKARFNKSV